MLYNDWLGDVTKRFQQEFEKIKTVNSFEYGDEFEVAVCNVLEKLLPRRFDVCRGHIVGRDGTTAGDDIIVYDAQRFPTIRALPKNSATLEHVPAEAVVAYIEAKHTLHVYGDEKDGQSLAKATRQIEKIKSIARPARTHNQIIPGLDLGANLTVQWPDHMPSIKNPYYAAIWARNIDAKEPDEFKAFSDRLGELGPHREHLPDMIVAGTSLALPTFGPANTFDAFSIKPFLCKTVGLSTIKNEISPWGMALAHLLWAIEWIQLTELPWESMMAEQAKMIGGIKWLDPLCGNALKKP